MIFFCMLCGASCENCNADQCTAGSTDEETSLLQVTMNTDERSKADGPWEKQWHNKQAVRAKARQVWLDKKEKERQWWLEQMKSKKSDKEANNPRLQGSDDEEEQTLVSTANPFHSVKLSLAEECPEYADQASCDEAVWLATLLSKLNDGKSDDLIHDASSLLSLEAWFESPAGPSGFFNYLDKDDKGGLDATELEEYGGEGLLQLMDVDGDGVASRHEVRIFLRGVAVLFKMLPATDHKIAMLPAPVMMKLAETVTLENTVPVGPASNPFTEVRAALKKKCPPQANKKSCKEAQDLAKFLEEVTDGTPKELLLAEAGTVMGLWYWFENPGGPAAFFQAVDADHKGTITASKVLSFTHSSNPKVVQLLDFIDTNNDGKASRYECQNFLRSSVLVMHKLPMLDILRADTDIPTMFGMADSVVQQAVTGSGPMAWAISMTCSVVMILAILYVHCWPSSKKKEQFKADEQDIKKAVHRSDSSSQGDSEAINSLDDMSDSQEEPYLYSGPPVMGSTFNKCKANCAAGACECPPSVPRIDMEVVNSARTENDAETACEDEADSKAEASSATKSGT